MDIATIAAGSDLDSLMAEKVMGWKPHIIAGSFASGWDTDGWRRMTFEPSTKIADAWAVVEHLQSTTRHFSLFYCEILCEWLCRMDKVRCVEEDARTKAWAETAPLAICRAALLAITV